MTLTKNHSPHGSLMALSTMKDEGPGVIEWVAHHLAVGFTDVMVFTNDCSDGTDAILQRLQAMDIGVYHCENIMPPGVKPHPSMLKAAHDDALVRASDWLLVLDSDEFLCINHPSGTLDGMVGDLNAAGASAMVITWRIFGSAGIRDWSRAPITDQFMLAAPPFWNKGWGVKTLLKFDHRYLRLGMHRPIIKSQHKDTDYPETVTWLNGSGTVLEDWFKFRGWRSIRRTVGFEWAQINHYALKSMDAYSLRKFRGNANLKKDKYNADYWSLQDRNEVPDLNIRRHAARRDEIMAELLADPELARLHDAAHTRAEARLVEYRASPAYQELVAGLVAASGVPITQVVAKPPKARDPVAVAAVQSKLELRRAEKSKTERRTEAPPGWGLAAASPYIAGPIDLSGAIPIEPVDNQGIRLPADPRVFTPAALEAVLAGKFDRRHARNIATCLGDAARFADIGGGIGFIALKARLTLPSLDVLSQDDRGLLVELGRAIALDHFADQPGSVRFSDDALRRDDDPADSYPGLAALLATFRPDALRMAPFHLPPAALAALPLQGLGRLILPFSEAADITAIRAAYAPALVPLGLTEDPKAAEGGSLLYRRG